MKTLDQKLIVLAVTGSIAAVETVKLAHELRRKGAIVQGVMSEAATRLIHPDALTYACGRETITRCTGMVEHVQYCGDGGSADLLLVAPCTANTVSKIACGIDDTPVTTFATTALGRRMPVVVVPAMHYAMFRHKVVVENLSKLSDLGIFVAEPRIEEGKAKIADINEIVMRCELELSGKPLLGKKVLITSGRCEEPVDDVRVLTTRSSGRMGTALALEAFRLGAEVTVVHRDFIHGVKNIRSDSSGSMQESVLKFIEENPVDIYISAAAISDFAPVLYSGKIPSGTDVELKLKPLSKLIESVMGTGRVDKVIAFKLGEDSEEMAIPMLKKGAFMVVANRPAVLGSDKGEFTLITEKEKIRFACTKQELAFEIFKYLCNCA